MKPRQPEMAKSDDLFRSRLDSILNPRHELVVLANKIDWDYLDSQVEPFFAVEGRPAIPSRLMIGLHLLKHMHQLSDEGVCARWVENPYYQYFCGEEYFQHQFPIQRSSMTHWRKRVGEVFFETLLQESLRIAFDSKALKKHQLKRVVVDTTVQPKAVAFPTDVQLRYKALCALVALAKQHQVPLRQSYLRVCKKAVMMSGRYRHAKQLKRARKAEKFVRIRLGRVIRDIRRQIQDDETLWNHLREPLQRAGVLFRQQQRSTEKCYSWHAPETECIGKGKAAKPYEFGCKVSVTTSINRAPGGHFVLHIGALHGRPFDGHTLKPVLDQYEQQVGLKPERIYVDKGYQGHRFEPRNRVFKSGQKRGVTGAIKKELRRRSLVEPIIGHLKADHHLGRNYLKGVQGDKLNVLLSGAGYNFRLLLKWFRLLFAQNLWALIVQRIEVWRQFLDRCRQIKETQLELRAF